MKRVSLATRAGVLVTVAAALPALFACLEHPIKRVEYEQSIEDEEGIAISVNKDVDVLFVIDNSGSMGEEQLNLSENFGAFINVLEAEDVRANYRIGITTTDNGNVDCKGSNISAPEAGNFVLSSCRERINDFASASDDTDARFACEDFCPEEWKAFDTEPTTTKQDPEMKRRPWIESVEGKTNLPEGLDTVTAMQCLGPQGINGCGFESHLESMYKALRRTTDEDENEFGFIRDNAILSIVFVTDEADCSFNTDWEAIFYGPEDDGNQVFWSLPEEQTAATSAVCWNAGVACTPQGAGTYDECHAQDKDINGNDVPRERADDDAVLFPVSRYIDLVQGFEDKKKEINPNQEVLVAAISGVPQAYPGEEIVYAQGTNASDRNSFQAKYGVAEGCSSQVAEAVPPVRLKEFADAFLQDEEDVNLFSVCNPSYEEALESIADAIRDQIRPPCMPACVQDVDPVREGVQVSCTMTETYHDDSGSIVKDNVPECEPDDTLPEDADACWVALTDQSGTTPSGSDDMQDACIDDGWNLEFRVVRREGVAARGGASVSATCQLSQNKAVDCPALPS